MGSLDIDFNAANFPKSNYCLGPTESNGSALKDENSKQYGSKSDAELLGI